MGCKFGFAILFVALLVLSGCSSRRPGTLRTSKTYPSSRNNTPETNHPNTRGRSTGHTSSSGNSYIDRYKSIAISEMNQYGIPASIKLAQALLESGNGNSYLATEANNHFGIKCGGVWEGRSITRPDDGPNDCFRVYSNPDDSFKDHSQFLLRKRYEALFTLKKDDYKGWAHGLKKAGYATNPRYAYLLIDLIERYDLHRYDKAETFVEQVKREDQVEDLIKEKEVLEEVVPPEEVKKPVAMIIYQVKANDTLYSISQQYGLSVDELIQINALEDENISVGQLLVVSK
ncbi:glucosaminidase domain-containing protein [Sphingobacterium sp. lm-10]|uniref:glucosaminidase domain-containing protein n=1 Tax=Sphingobacterium sp. lm-10 TaxID=2944904 RepID=UPI00202091D6|nr:glucosaminidase domain-containing protein [Sphingobacterium sp. lm-10]MCL7988577.1 glucosaminidase domain-containing protein [Sphingobacterium sp. lm-10]